MVDQIRADRTDGVHRVNLLTINDAAKYLGLSRYGVEKLVKVGKLRRLTIAPMSGIRSRKRVSQQRTFWLSLRHPPDTSGGLLQQLLAAGLRPRSRSVRASQNSGNAREHSGVSDLRWETLRCTFGDQSRRGFAYLLGLNLRPAPGASVVLGHAN